MDKRYLENRFSEYSDAIKIDIETEKVKNLICTYVDAILENTNPTANEDTRGDLYVGNAGIAYMFWRLNQSEQTHDLYPALDHAVTYIRNAKTNAARFKQKHESCAFLCGNAGIYAVSAAISYKLKMQDTLQEDLENFVKGVEPCLKINFSPNGCDEVLVGRAGYLSGCYWLNDIIEPKPIMDKTLEKICEVMINSGRKYAADSKAPLPLMYQYHGTEYLGAAHGLSAILQNILDSPWFKADKIHVSKTKLADIKNSIDFYLRIQDEEGNFPVALEDLRSGREKRLIHWCHGAPGAVYLFAKAYLIFKEKKYLNACKKAADLVWKKGLLKKGPGICHGIAGNGYVFLLLYRLTGEKIYLYRAIKFSEFLLNPEFNLRTRIPDRPFSLYEGVAGTVCFLIDLLQPSKAHFPFMEIFH